VKFLLQPPVTSSLFDLNILLNTLFSDTLSARSQNFISIFMEYEGISACSQESITGYHPEKHIVEFHLILHSLIPRS
jgi:hypothetical protein